MNTTTNHHPKEIKAGTFVNLKNGRKITAIVFGTILALAAVIAFLLLNGGARSSSHADEVAPAVFSTQYYIDLSLTHARENGWNPDTGQENAPAVLSTQDYINMGLNHALENGWSPNPGD